MTQVFTTFCSWYHDTTASPRRVGDCWVFTSRGGRYALLSVGMACALGVVAIVATVDVRGNDELRVAFTFWCMTAMFALHAFLHLVFGDEAWLDDRTGKSVIRRSWPGRRPPDESVWKGDTALRTASVAVPSFSTWSGYRRAMGIALISGGRVFLLAVLAPGPEIDRFVERLPSSISSRISTDAVFVGIHRARLL